MHVLVIVRLFVRVRAPVPVHAGSGQIPQGSGSCLSSLTFVIAGTLASLERKQAEDLIKRYGGRVTQQVVRFSPKPCASQSTVASTVAAALSDQYACGAGLVKDDASTAGHRRLRCVRTAFALQPHSIAHSVVPSVELCVA